MGGGGVIIINMVSHTRITPCALSLGGREMGGGKHCVDSAVHHNQTRWGEEGGVVRRTWQ